MDIRAVRQQFPQYSDLSDEQLVRALHAKFYADMPYDEFARRAGLDKKSGVMASLGRGAESTLSSLRTGIGALVNPEEAATAGIHRGEDIDRRYESQVGLDKVKDVYTQRGLLPAAGEVLRQVPHALAEQAPNIAATLGTARLGAMAGAPFGPVGSGIGAVAGAVAPSLVQQFGSNVERQAVEQQQAGQPVSINRMSAAAAAAPQAALDVAATFIPLGRTLVGKALGKNVEALLAKGSGEAAEKLAQETLAKTLLKGGATSLVVEMPTEMAQQMLERAQAGLPLTSADALREYGEAGYQAGLIAPIGAAGRMTDKGAARQRVADTEAGQRAEAAKAVQATAQQEEQAAVARYQDPEFARQVEADYRAAEERAATLKEALKVPKDAPMADKLAAKQAGEELKAFIESDLKPKALEYNKVKYLLAQQPEQAAQDVVALEGQLFASEAPQAPDKDLFGNAVERSAMVSPTPERVAQQHGELRQQMAIMEGALEEQRAVVAEAAQAGDTSRSMQEAAKFRQLEKAVKDLEAQIKQLPSEPKAAPTGDALNRQYAAAQKALAMAGEQGDVDAVERAVRRLDKLRKEQPGLFTKDSVAATAAVDQQLADEMATGRETEAARRVRVEEAVASIRGLGEKEPEYAGEARRDRHTALEIQEMGRGRMPTTVVEQGVLFPEETGAGAKTSEETAKNKRDDLVLQLQAARRNMRDDPQRYRPEVERLLAELQELKTRPGFMQPQPRGEATAPLATELAGTRMPQQLPESATQVPVERRMAASGVDERALHADMERLGDVGGDVMRAVKTNYSALSNAGVLPDVAEFVRRLRVGQATDDIQRDLTSKIQDLEGGKRSDEHQTGEMFPAPELQGVVFDTAEDFQKYMASDALAEIRKEVGLALQTAARAKNEVDTLQAQAKELQQSVDNLRRMLAASKSTAPQKINAALQQYEKAIAAAKQQQKELGKKLAPAHKALDAAQKQLDTARAAQMRVAERIAAHQRSFAPDVAAQQATDAAVAALASYNNALVNPNATQDRVDELAKAAHDASVKQIAALKRQENPLARSIVAFKDKEQTLQQRMDTAQAGVAAATGRLTEAQKAFDSAEREFADVPAYKDAMKAAMRQVSVTQGILTRARGETQRAIERQTTELEKRTEELEAVEKKAAGIERDIARAQQERTKRADAIETQAQREERDAEVRREEQSRLERLEAIPGQRVSYEDYRKALDKLMRLPERIKALDAKAKDETQSETTRRKARFDARQARNEAKLAFGVMSNDPDIRERSAAALDGAIVELQEKIDAKKIAVSEPGKARSTIASRRKELSEMQAKMREWKKLATQLQRRGVVTPIQTAEQRAAARQETFELGRAEQRLAADIEGASDRLPARVIGPVVRKSAQPANIRTGELETQTERKVGMRKPVQQAGSPRAVTAKQAVRGAAKDTAQEQALLELSRLDTLSEKVETALDAAEEAGDNAKASKYRAYIGRLDAQRAKVEKQLDKAVKQAAPSVTRGAERVSTNLRSAVLQRIRAGDLQGALEALRSEASSDQVRALAKRLQPLLGDTAVVIDPDVQFEGQSVAGLYEPATNTITLHPDALTEEDFLHEAVHAATDQVLLAPESRLTADQRIARTELENMRRMLVKLPQFRDEPIGNVREFASEAMTNPQLQAKLEALGKPRSLWERFKALVVRLLGIGGDNGPGPRAKELVDRIMSSSRKLEAAAAPSVRRTEPATAVQALADEIIARPQGFRERFEKNLGLSAEMWGVDMRAPLVKALGAAGERAARQATYLVRKADARMSHTYAALSNGPLQVKKDSKGFMTVEAGNGPSAKDIFAAVSRIPGKDAKQKMELAQVYLTAKRAQRVGWDKLDFHPDRVEDLKQQATAVMQEVNSDPATKAALEDVSRLYNDYNKGLIGFLAQSGAISRAKAAELTKHGDYVPFYRVLGNGTAELVLGEGNVYSVGNIRTQPYLKELKGGDQKLLPLNEALVRNTMLLTDMGLRNLATKDVAYALQAIGKDAGVMKIRKGPGAADPNTIRFRQEPDPADSKDDGERHVVVDTTGTPVEGIPADMLTQSLEGSFSALPSFLKVAGWFGDVLRSGVTRNPMYIARQLVRDPMAAAFTAGLDSGPLTAVAKSIKEFSKQMDGSSATAETLLRKGVVQSQIFTGDPDDMAKFSLQLAQGDQGAYHKFIAFWDRAAMRADAATRAQMYESALKQGASEMEAELQAMEMMNFNKRGISPTVQFASRMIPFFNAQIQGLNVLYKAATGNMPLNEKLAIKEKFFKRALFLAGMTMMYSAAMDDDEVYKNARPRDRYSHFIVPNPLGGEHLKLPIPFEVGVLFKALPEAMMDIVKGKFTDQEWKAIKQLLTNQIPGATSYGVPQIARPTLEVLSNANWFTGREIESASDRRLSPQERVGRNTSELAKRFSEVLAQQPVEGARLSPKQIEHLVSGYLGTLPVAVARMVNSVFASEETNATTPSMRGSDLPVFGALFQRDVGGGPVDAAYAQAQALEEAANTYKKMIAEGRVAKANAFRENAVNVVASPQLAQRFTKQMTNFNKAEQAVRRSEKDPDRMRERLDELDRQRNEFAKLYLQAVSSLAK